MKSSRIAMIVGVVVIAVVLGFLAVRSRAPKSGTEGAIGAANRYTAQQIADQDVTLKDKEVQAFLQSDTFHQIATNAEFRAFVEQLAARGTDARVQVAERLSQTVDALQGLKLSDNAVAALKDESFAKLPAAQVEALMGKPGLAVLGDAAFAKTIDNQRVREAAARGVAAYVEAFRMADARGALPSNVEALLAAHPDLLAVMADQGFAKWALSENSRALVDALNKPALNTDALAAAMADMSSRQLIVAENAFAKMGDSKALITALQDPGFAKILASGADLSKTLIPNE